MGLLNNPCRGCEFCDRCTDPALLRSYVTAATEDGCPTFARLKNQTNIRDSWNNRYEEMDETDSIPEESTNNFFDNLDIEARFDAAFATAEKKPKEKRETQNVIQIDSEMLENEQQMKNETASEYEHLYNILHQIDLFDNYTICSPQCMIQVCLQEGEVNVIRRTPAAKRNELGGEWQEWKTFKAPKLHFTRIDGTIHRIGAEIYFREGGENWYQLVNGFNLSLWNARNEYDFEQLEWRPIRHDKVATSLSLALHPIDSESNRAFKALEEHEEAERILSSIVLKSAYGSIDTSRKDYVCLPEESPAVRQLRRELKKHETAKEKAEKDQRRQTMLDAMSPAEKEQYLKKENDKKKKALERKEQEKKAKELKKQKEEEENQIRKKRLHIHQMIFWSIYFVSAIVCFICSDEWWHYVLLILGMIVLAIGRGFVRLITD